MIVPNLRARVKRDCHICLAGFHLPRSNQSGLLLQVSCHSLHPIPFSGQGSDFPIGYCLFFIVFPPNLSGPGGISMGLCVNKFGLLQTTVDQRPGSHTGHMWYLASATQTNPIIVFLSLLSVTVITSFLCQEIPVFKQDGAQNNRFFRCCCVLQPEFWTM